MSYAPEHMAAPIREKTGGRLAWLGHSYFCLTLCWLELALHLFAGGQPIYIPVYLCFALSAGLILGGLIALLPQKSRRWTAAGLAVVLWAVYGGELLCKKILQTFYPLLSVAGTAMGNNLTEYDQAIWDGVWKCLPALVLLLLPVLPPVVWGGRLFPQEKGRGRTWAGLLVAGASAHLMALLLLLLPWPGDMTPGYLYRRDTNTNDQVEQLGLLTMLRLDVKHTLFPPETLPEDPLPPPVEPDGSEEEPPDQSEEEPKYQPHVMDVDLDTLAQSGDNNVAWLAKYFRTVVPTMENEYTGMFKGYNVIFVTLEGFSGYAIHPELTPTLYRLTHEGFVFNNFYTALHYTSTSGGECQNLLGLYPKAGNPITMRETGVLGTDCYFSLAQQLGRLGYTNLGYHGNEDMYGRYDSHTNLGYTWKQYLTGLPLEMTADGSTYAWPQSDVYVARATMDEYMTGDTPFNVYYLTISGHMPYNFNRVAVKYRDQVNELPYSDTTRAYLAVTMEVDRMFQALLDGLEAAGKLDNTLIVATSDHVPYFNVDTLEELAGESFGSSKDVEALNEANINFDLYRNSLILWSASMDEPVVVDKVGCQVDILPTVSNLLGLEYDSRMLAGRDLLSEDPGLVVFSSRCWLTDKGLYNRYDQSFTPAQGVEMTGEEQAAYVERVKQTALNRLAITEPILNSNFYHVAFGESSS